MEDKKMMAEMQVALLEGRPEPPAIRMPEPERCRCCRMALVVYEGRCLNCGAIVLRKAA